MFKRHRFNEHKLPPKYRSPILIQEFAKQNKTKQNKLSFLDKVFFRVVGNESFENINVTTIEQCMLLIKVTSKSGRIKNQICAAPVALQHTLVSSKEVHNFE